VVKPNGTFHVVQGSRGLLPNYCGGGSVDKEQGRGRFKDFERAATGRIAGGNQSEEGPRKEEARHKTAGFPVDGRYTKKSERRTRQSNTGHQPRPAGEPGVLTIKPDAPSILAEEYYSTKTTWQEALLKI
jgi:hypothetical protein